MELDFLNLLGKNLSAKDWKNMNLIIVNVSVLSLQFQRKIGFVLVYIGLYLRKILNDSLKKWMK